MSNTNSLLEKNIYDVKGKVLICGTCLQNMQPQAYKKLIKEYDCVLNLCLEQEHINMAITKICAILSTNNVERLSFASVNKSPHCTQLHYIKNEINRVMNQEKIPKIENFIISENEIHEISDEAISISKNLLKITELITSQK